MPDIIDLGREINVEQTGGGLNTSPEPGETKTLH